MLRIDNIDVYYGDIQALFNVSLKVNNRELVGLLGANGAGKTTLLQTISGILKPRSGTIRFKDQNLGELKPNEITALGISQIPEGRKLFGELSVLENLKIGAFTCGNKTEVNRRLEQVYKYFPFLQERSNQQAGTLSGGQQQMLTIGRSLMANPTLLMLDEPSFGLAPKLVQQISEILEKLHKEGLTILLVEQNTHMALNLVDRAYVLETGRISLEGSASELKDDEKVRSAYLGVKVSR